MTVKDNNISDTLAVVNCWSAKCNKDIMDMVHHRR